jgi:signal transduction histidine kinase
LKSFSRSNWTKLASFILIVAMVAGISGMFFYGYFSGINPEVLLTEDYRESEAYGSDLRSLAYGVAKILEGDQETIPGGVFFYGENEEGKISWPGNITENHFVEGVGEYFYLEDGRFKSSETDETIFPYGSEASYEKAYFAFEDGYMQLKQRDWTGGREALIPLTIWIGALFFGTVVLLIYQFMVTGKKSGDEEVHLEPVDRIYLEILFVGLVLLGLLWLSGISNLLYSNDVGFNANGAMSSRQTAGVYMASALTALVTAGVGVILLSVARRIKGKKMIESSFVFGGLRRGLQKGRSFMDGSRFDKSSLTRVLHQRQIYFVAGSFLLVILTFLMLIVATPLAIIPPIMEGFLIYWYFKYNKETFDEIEKGFDDSLQEQMKSERMKINLVTNVSHDLKTPLTSIISYVDLLSREEEMSPVARDYVRILSDKSERLKSIVSDLFDLARSTSGDIDTDFEDLDLKKLVEQTLVDMEDSIEESGFNIRTELPEEPVNIHSDGKKLYRVIQNLLDNALKYSLEGTRIYVDLGEEHGRATLRIANTAGYEMNFSKDEILQRFFRGDQARSGEGSGLGLSIAESFTRVSGGDFDLQVDGDQFKVFMRFPVTDSK